SNVGHGSASIEGYMSRHAVSEFAPGSPWKAIRFVFAAISTNPLCNQFARPRQILRCIDPERNSIHDLRIDPHSGLQRTQLFQSLTPLQHGRAKRHESLQRRAPVGIDADMMVERPFA